MTTLAEPRRSTATPPAPATDLTPILWIIAGIGAVLRIARWTHWRSLWLDEIYLTDSLSRSLHDLLFKPLDAWQAAPPGYLFLLHLVRAIFGSGERSLRLPALIFGLASLPLFVAVARRMLHPFAALVAAAMFVTLGPLIYYSNEVKPYSCDVAASLAILLLVLRWTETGSPRRAAVAAIVGSIAIFFSYPAVFILAGAGIWLLAIYPSRAAMLICLAWAAAFAAEYFLFLRPVTQADTHQHLVQYWLSRGGFMPALKRDAVTWIFSSFAAIAASPAGMWIKFPDAALLGLIVGAVFCIQRRDHRLLLLAPLPFIFLAAALRQYPFADRLALFFVPLYLLLIALAAQSLWTNLPARSAAAAMIALILIPSIQRAAGDLVRPPGREESLPLYRWIAERYRTGDVIYLSRFAVPSFDYYRAQTNLPEGAIVHAQPDCTDLVQLLDDVKSLAGAKRVWVVVIHADASDGPGALTLSAFTQIGVPHLSQSHEETGAGVQLFDCSKP
jgi:uncharacterized membrane protein